MPEVSTKDTVIAFETAFNFLQQGDLEIDYKEFKAFKSLKRKVKLLNNEKLIQPHMGQSPAKTTSEKFRRILTGLFGALFSQEYCG